MCVYTVKEIGMPYSPTLLHIAGGTLGLLSGTAAICFRKGCRPHVLAGRVFVASMLIMAMGAIYQTQARGNKPVGLGCAAYPTNQA